MNVRACISISFVVLWHASTYLHGDLTLATGDVVRSGSVEETRLRILSAARELFAQKGSRGTTTRQIAQRAGVNEATLFRHFGTKSQLLQAMLD